MKNTLLKLILITPMAYFSNTASADCTQPIIPIIPDGHVASKDELLGASSSLGQFQIDINDYRNCLTEQSVKIVGDDEASTLKKEELLNLYNASVDKEELAAAEFNSAIRIFNDRTK